MNNNLFNSYKDIYKCLTQEHSQNDLSNAVNRFLQETNNEKDRTYDDAKFIMACVEYLYKEAPDDEQNLFMLADLLESKFIDALFELVQEKDENHIALRYYFDFLKVAGNKKESLQELCRKRFSAIGTSRNLFKYAQNKEDIVLFAKLIILNFKKGENIVPADENELIIYYLNLYEKSLETKKTVTQEDLGETDEENELMFFWNQGNDNETNEESESNWNNEDEQSDKENEKNVSENFPPKQGKKGVNFYWIYALLFAVLLAMSFWGFKDSTVAINNVQLKDMIVQRDVDKIVFMTQKQIANIYIKPSHINKDTLYKKAFEANQKEPHFYIDISDIGAFNSFIKEMEMALLESEMFGKTDEEKQVIAKNFKNIVIVNDHSKSWNFNNLFWILIIALFIIFIISWNNKNKQSDKINMNTSPKLPIAFICLLTISAIAAPFVIVNTIKQDIINYIKEIEDKRPQPPKTYTASNFTAYGNAINDNNWIGNIEKNSGFRFTVNSEKPTTVKLSIKYKSENAGAILKINGNAQNLYFTSTNGNWSGGQGYNQKTHKTVIVKLQQGDNYIEFSSGWLTDFAPDIAEITILFDNNLKKDYIVGVWKGTYDNGKAKVTLTINNDMTGVYEFSRKEGKGSYSVTVNYSNGRYTVSGKDWIDKPQRGWWSFANLTGNIIDGKFSGSDFILEKAGIIVLLPASTAKNKPQSWRYTFNTPPDNWSSDSFNDNQWQQGKAPFGTEQNLQNTRWTTSQIYIRSSFNISDVSSISNSYFCIWHDEDVQIYLNGQLAINRSGYITNYESFEFNKTLLKNGVNTIAAKCIQTNGGQLIDIGVFVTTKEENSIVSTSNTEKENKSTSANSTTTGTTETNFKQESAKVDDNTAKYNTAVKNAEAAFAKGNYDAAFKYYTEAGNYNSSIKSVAARKFRQKAQEYKNVLGEQDETVQKLQICADALSD